MLFQTIGVFGCIKVSGVPKRHIYWSIIVKNIKQAFRAVKNHFWDFISKKFGPRVAAGAYRMHAQRDISAFLYSTAGGTVQRVCRFLLWKIEYISRNLFFPETLCYKYFLNTKCSCPSMNTAQLARFYSCAGRNSVEIASFSRRYWRGDTLDGNRPRFALGRLSCPGLVRHRFFGLLAKIKCSICSFKINTLNGVD